MAVLIPEAATVIGSTVEGGAAAEGAAASGGTTASGVASKLRGGSPKPAEPAGPRGAATPASSKKKSTGSKKKGKGGGAFGGFATPKLSKSSNAHRLVIAEFILVIFLIGFTPILTRKSEDGKHLYVANDFVRLSAACLTFFVLALLSNSPRSSRFAAAFGGLIALGTLFNANAGLAVIAKLFGNAGTKGGKISTADEGTTDYKTATYNPKSAQA